MNYIITKDIKSTIASLSNEHSMKEKDIDYNIVDTALYIKNNKTDNSYKLFEDVIPRKYINKKNGLRKVLVNSNSSLKEAFKIHIKMKIKTIWDLEYILSLGSDEDFLEPKIIIKPKIKFQKELVTKQKAFDKLYDLINKIKAEHSIITSIFNESTKKDINTLVSMIFDDQFDKNYEIRLFDSNKPTPTTNPEIVKHYKNKKSIEQDDLILMVLPAKIGENGINSLGRIINANKNYDEVEIKYDENDIFKEIINGIERYYSKNKGLVEFDKNTIKISNVLVLKNISRLDNSIPKYTQNNLNNLTLDINQSNMLKDSIGAGVHLVSEVINVKGHIGNLSKLSGKQINIDGSTHKTSVVTGKDVTININRGTVKCNNGFINMLENGKVLATDIEIDTVIGGLIEGENVIINNIKKPAIIKALNSIKINKISCENNSLIITNNISITQKKLENLEKEILEKTNIINNNSNLTEEDSENIKNVILKKNNQIKNIKYNYNKAKITIQGIVPKDNKIKFYIGKKYIEYISEKSKTFKTFKLDKVEDMDTGIKEIILLPVNKKI